MGLSAERMEKIAVTLKQLREATAPLMGKVIRKHPKKKATMTAGGGFIETAKGPDFRIVAKGDYGKATLRHNEGIRAKKERLKTLNQIRRMKADSSGVSAAWGIPDKSSAAAEAAKLKKDIAAGIKRTKRTPAEREALNRSVLLHESREIRELRRGPDKKFKGHHNAAPPLQDLNIAATAEGNIARIGDDIRKMRRPEIGMLKRRHPTSFGRLDLGNERLSRHAIKRLTKLHANRGRR